MNNPDDFNKRVWWKALDPTWKRIFKLAIDINHNPTDDELNGILKLESIDCKSPYVLSLDPLQNLKGLRKLNCSNTKIGTLEKIRDLTLIDELDCSSTNISSLEPLIGFKNLWRLNCSETKLHSLQGVENLIEIAYLDCSNTAIQDLKPLKQLTKLKILNCDNTQIFNLGPITALPNYTEIISYSGTLAESSEEKERNKYAEIDPLFEEAARLIVMHQQGSTSLIQRKLKLGYNRAGLLIDQLEAAGIVGPFEDSVARQVMIKDEQSLDFFLSNYRTNQLGNDIKEIAKETRVSASLPVWPVCWQDLCLPM